MTPVIVILFFALSSPAFAKTCSVPASPINWIMRYCALEIGSDDEIAIQESTCFKLAKEDLSTKNECAVNKKYKLKSCGTMVKNLKKYKSLSECLKDGAIVPFIIGD